MRLKQLLYVLVIILPLLFSSACEQNNPGPADPLNRLPEATMTGAGTFACLMNGEPWIANRGGFISNISVVYDSQTGVFSANGARNVPEQEAPYDAEGMGISATVNNIGIFQVTHANFGGRMPPCQFQLFESDHPFDDDNFLEITRLDTENRIASGRFALFFIDSECGDTLRFTDGRFDQKF